MPSFTIYIRFCSAQLRSAALLQQKCESNPAFKEFCKSLQSNPNSKGLPLSSFLIKPMQRITKYPLLVKKVRNINLEQNIKNKAYFEHYNNFVLKVLEYTSEDHPDRQNLEEALVKAEEASFF